LYADASTRARQKNMNARSSMNKDQLERAVDGAK